MRLNVDSSAPLALKVFSGVTKGVETIVRGRGTCTFSHAAQHLLVAQDSGMLINVRLCDSHVEQNPLFAHSVVLNKVAVIAESNQGLKTQRWIRLPLEVCVRGKKQKSACCVTEALDDF